MGETPDTTFTSEAGVRWPLRGPLGPGSGRLKLSAGLGVFPAGPHPRQGAAWAGFPAGSWALHGGGGGSGCRVEACGHRAGRGRETEAPRGGVRSRGAPGPGSDRLRHGDIRAGGVQAATSPPPQAGQTVCCLQTWGRRRLIIRGPGPRHLVSAGPGGLLGEGHGPREPARTPPPNAWDSSGLGSSGTWGLGGRHGGSCVQVLAPPETLTRRALSPKALGAPEAPGDPAFPGKSHRGPQAPCGHPAHDKVQHTQSPALTAQAGSVSPGHKGPGSLELNRDCKPRSPRWLYSTAAHRQGASWAPLHPGPHRGQPRTELRLSGSRRGLPEGPPQHRHHGPRGAPGGGSQGFVL